MNQKLNFIADDKDPDMLWTEMIAARLRQLLPTFQTAAEKKRAKREVEDLIDQLFEN